MNKKRLGEILFDAVYDEDIELIYRLIFEGIDVNYRNPVKNQCIHVAAKKGSSRTLKILLKAGGNINSCGMNGNTPLHYLASSANELSEDILLEVSDIVLKYGADFGVKNDKGYTARDIVEHIGNQTLLNILDKHYIKEMKLFNSDPVSLPIVQETEYKPVDKPEEIKAEETNALIKNLAETKPKVQQVIQEISEEAVPAPPFRVERSVSIDGEELILESPKDSTYSKPLISKREEQSGKEVIVELKQSEKSLGVLLEEHGNFFLVLDLNPVGPAARSGIKKGDKIVSINDFFVSSQSLDDVISFINTELQTKNKLRIQVDYNIF
eukprot:maker-scaffold_9-snap-gene-13.22-mRNA-1 protein AED:0.12 eAED:0.12 QI:7/1/1/1/1/1/2/393/324